MIHDSYNGASDKRAHYTDRADFGGRILFFDAIDRDKIANIIDNSGGDWLDFVAGCRQGGRVVECNPNGSYTVR